MTYKELLSQLSELSEEQLNCAVCLYDVTTHDEHYDLELAFAANPQYVVSVNPPIIRF